MNKFFQRILLLISLQLFVLASINISLAQGISASDQELLDRAEFSIQNGQFGHALEFYKKLQATYPNSLDFKFKLGICYLNKADEHEKAIPLFESVQQERPKAEDIDFYLGQAYHNNNRFDDAIAVFERYLTRRIEPENKKATLHYIENCKNAKALMAKPSKVKVKNLGTDINTKFSEYTPIITADKSVLIYTYRGEKSLGGRMNQNYEPDPDGDFFEDVFMSRRVGDNWPDPDQIGNTINGPGHDAAIALSPDGQKLFVYKSTYEDYGDIYVSYLNGVDWSTPVKVKGQVNTPESWEGSCTISADEKTFYFVSERKGGLGGRDIYKASVQVDGTWGEVKNLGPNINTPFNEDAPFIQPDGSILYFSSEGHNSMGGYDIFRSELKDDGSFTKAENFGFPVNTPDDDKYYVAAADGKTGYFSSKRAGGQGEADIYEVDLGETGKKTSLLLLTGLVTLDGKPVECEIVVYFIDKNKGDLIQGDYISNAATGKYLINLPGGFNYSIQFIMAGFEEDPIIKTVINENVNDYMESVVDVHFKTGVSNKVASKPIIAYKPTSEPKVEVPVEEPAPVVEAPAPVVEEPVKVEEPAPTPVPEPEPAPVVVEEPAPVVIKESGPVTLTLFGLNGAESSNGTFTDGVYFFDALPNTNDCLFKLTGENTEVVKEVFVNYEGEPRKASRSEDGNFRFEKVAEPAPVVEAPKVVEPSLSLLDQDGFTVLSKVNKNSDNVYAFDNLPEPDLCGFRLEGDNTESISSVDVMVNGSVKSALKNENGIFKFEKQVIPKPAPVVEVAPVAVEEPKPEPTPEPVVEVKPEPEPVVELPVSLTLIGEDGTPVNAGSFADGVYFFDALPSEEKCTFQLKGSNTDNVQDVLVNFAGEPRKAIRNADNVFKFEIKAPEPVVAMKVETPQPEPIPLPEPTPEPVPEPTPEPVVVPEPTPEPVVIPEPTPEPVAVPEPTPEPVAVPEPTPEPVAVPEPTPEPTPEPVVVPEPTPEPEPTPAPEPPAPKPKPAPAAKVEYADLLNLLGDQTADGLVFKVQIGAFKTKPNVNFSKFEKYGVVSSQKFPDGITRYTVGEAKTMNEAEAIKRKIKADGINDAFVTGLYNNKRILLSDLEKLLNKGKW